MTALPAPLGVAILAGGKSSRMGHDKASLDVDGQPLLQRVAFAVEPLVATSPLAIVGGEPDLVELTGVGNSAHVIDAFPGEGPLGGVLSALRATTAQWMLIVACDLPDLDTSGLVQLCTEAVATDADVCVPLVAGRYQWHVAVWNRRCLAPLEQSFANGERSLWRAASAQRLTAVVPARHRHITDLDTPVDVSEFLGKLS